MSTLTDLQAADAAIKAAVASAVTLIQSLQAAQAGGGTVPDAQIESVVADLNAAAAALSGAATPAPAPAPAAATAKP